MGQLARWLTFIEQFDFEVVFRAGAKHENADGWSRRPDVHKESPFAVHGVTTDEIAEDASGTELDGVTGEVSGSARQHQGAIEQTMAEQQQHDPEIGLLVRMRLTQTHPPSIAEVHSESEAAKELHSQWDELEVHSGLVYRRSVSKHTSSTLCNYYYPVRSAKTS